MEENDKPKELLPSLCQEFSETTAEEIKEDKKEENLAKERKTPPIKNTQLLKADIARLLAEGEKAVLDKLIYLIENCNPTNITDIEILVNAVRMLADIRISHEWTERFKKVAQKDIKKLTPPMASQGGSMLNKVKGAAIKVEKEKKGDMREGLEKAKAELDKLMNEADNLAEEELGHN